MTKLLSTKLSRIGATDGEGDEDRVSVCDAMDPSAPLIHFEASDLGYSEADRSENLSIFDSGVRI